MRQIVRAIRERLSSDFSPGCMQLPAPVSRQPDVAFAWAKPEDVELPADFEPKPKTFRLGMFREEKRAGEYYTPCAVVEHLVGAVAIHLASRLPTESEAARWADDGGRVHEPQSPAACQIDTSCGVASL